MKAVSLRSLFYVMEHLIFLVAVLRRTENLFSLKIAQKLWFSRRTDFQFSLRIDFMEQPSGLSTQGMYAYILSGQNSNFKSCQSLEHYTTSY